MDFVEELTGIGKFFSDTLKELILGSALRDNLEYIFLTGINESTVSASHDLASLPSAWNPTLWGYIATLNQQIFMPIAGVILAFGLTMEVYNLATSKNNLHEIDIQDFLLLLLKMGIAFLVVKNVFPLLLGVFDIAAFAIDKAAAISIGSGGTTAVDINLYVDDVLANSFGRGMMTLFISMLVRLTMMVFNLAITVLVFGRMIQIYLYCSVAAIPAAAIISKELDMSKNYFKNICALGMQGFMMMFCLGAYSALVKNVSLSPDINSALLQVLVYAVLLIAMLFKTSSIAKSVMNSH